jgi:hypothetical protein
MIPKGCKRVAEVDFPIAEVSKHAAREWPAVAQAQPGSTEPTLREPIKDPARFEWHEVTKVAHYSLSLDALTKPMQVREESPPYGENR